MSLLTSRGGRVVWSMCQIQVDTHSKTRVQIPAWDYDIDHSEVEIHKKLAFCKFWNTNLGDVCPPSITSVAPVCPNPFAPT